MIINLFQYLAIIQAIKYLHGNHIVSLLIWMCNNTRLVPLETYFSDWSSHLNATIESHCLFLLYRRKWKVKQSHKNGNHNYFATSVINVWILWWNRNNHCASNLIIWAPLWQVKLEDNCDSDNEILNTHTTDPIKARNNCHWTSKDDHLGMWSYVYMAC